MKVSKIICAIGNSLQTEIIYGVPQGSAIGSTLFLLYINSISALNPNGEIKLMQLILLLNIFRGTSMKSKSWVRVTLKNIFWLNFHKFALNFSNISFIFISNRPIVTDKLTEVMFEKIK